VASFANDFRSWLEQTHSPLFELQRHFFSRFFDSDLVSTPGQWKVVASGAVAILASLSIIFTQAYYSKYLHLKSLPAPDLYRLSAIADTLFLITLSMVVMGLFTTLQWPQLFPGLRDYLALASLPVRMREVFAAKFSALMIFACAVVGATTLLPSLIFPMILAGRFMTPSPPQIAGLLIANSLAALFLFWTLVALQGVLLNLLPVRLFARISLAIQGLLLTVLLGGLPLVFKIPTLYPLMSQRPDWIVWIPPCWFLGLHQVIRGNHEPMAAELARIALAATAASAAAAIASYMWSYRRHRIRLLECPADVERTRQRTWPGKLCDLLVKEPAELAVFAFTGKTLARSRTHRLVLTAFLALAIAAALETIVSLAAGFVGTSARAGAWRITAVSVPLTLSLFVLAGFGYMFRLPVELRANWVFRLNEPGNGAGFQAGTARFLLYAGVIPVALVSLPLQLRVLGAQQGLSAAALCLLASLALMELVLARLHKIPFTCAYLPGRRPLVETVILYGVAVTAYVTVLGFLIGAFSRQPVLATGLGAAMLALWWRMRSARIEDRHLGRMEFEELPEVSVLTLSIEKD
jgi:hypothetical protein